MSKKRTPPRPKNAASLVIHRRGKRGIEVVMGRRHARARFKPGVYVFPGGILEPADFRARPGSALDSSFTGELAVAGSYRQATALAMAAVRETLEESGLVVAEPGDVGANPDETWRRMRALGVAPALSRLGYLGRAITPSTRPMRFHARFFCVDARHASGALRSNGELDDLRWISLAERPRLPLMNVTTRMLELLERRLAGFDDPPLYLGGFRPRVATGEEA